MSWRTVLTLVLLVAAAISGWSVWTHRPDRASTLFADASRLQGERIEGNA